MSECDEEKRRKEWIGQDRAEQRSKRRETEKSRKEKTGKEKKREEDMVCRRGCDGVELG